MRAPQCNSVLTVAIGMAIVVAIASQPEPAIPESGTTIRRPSDVPETEVVQAAFKPNTTLVATLVDLDIPRDIAHNVAKFIQPVFDVRNFRSGNFFKLKKDTDGNVETFEYKINDEKVLEVKRNEDSYKARIATLPLERRETTIVAEITSGNNNLYSALGEENEQAVQLAEKVASIFAWDVDFNSDLQKSDKIRVIVPALYHEGQFVKWGDIEAAELVNGGKTRRAYRFDGSYYDAKGNALKRTLQIGRAHD